MVDQVDLHDYWTPWELHGSYFAAEWLERWVPTMFGPEMVVTPAPSLDDAQRDA